ncbi:MAG: ribosome maturation factor RimP [Oscillospiraceae bacterium]|nr:ribosome maturation factor RimP [Oscillospiraceae bacterium]
MSKITDKVWALAEPVAKENGCEVWDVEYVKEAGQNYLRVYIDREEGVDLSQCEAVSRALDPILEEVDPIPDSYIFEVSSAGAERALKRPGDFQRFIGSLVEVRLYKSKFDSKVHIGRLLAYDDGAVEVDSKGEPLRFEKNEVAGVRLRME